MTPPSARHVWRLRPTDDGLHGRGCVHEGFEAVGHALSKLAELFDGPVGCIALGDVVVAGVVNEPLGQPTRGSMKSRSATVMKALVTRGASSARRSLQYLAVSAGSLSTTCPHSKEV